MAQLNFGGTTETVVIRDEFPLEKAREVLKNETIAVIGYGVQGPGQALNLRDNGFNVIVGQREGKTYDKAVADGWVPGETLFGIEEACEKGTIVMCLLSDAAVMSVWPPIKPYLTAGKALYFSHGFAITWNGNILVFYITDNLHACYYIGASTGLVAEHERAAEVLSIPSVLGRPGLLERGPVYT